MTLNLDKESAARLLQLQWQLTATINGEDGPTDILARVLESALELETVEGICVWFLDDGDGRLKLRQYQGMSPEAAEHLAHIPADSSLHNQILVGREVVGDWEFTWEELTLLLKKDGWTEVAVWPLSDGENITGALAGLSRASQGIADGECQVLRSLALQLGGLIGRARREADLRNSRFNLKQLLETFEDFVFVVRSNGQILYCNADEENHSDLGPASPEGRNIEDYLPGAGSYRIAGPETGQSQVWSARLREASGRLRPVEVRTFEGRWEQSTVRYFLCRDLSHQVVMEKERARLITAIEQSDDSIIITNSAGSIQFTNPAFSRLTGYTPEEVLGANPRLLKSDLHSQEFYRQMWSTLSRGEVWRGRITNRRKDGELFTEFATISPVRDSSGIITHFVCVKRDVTKEVDLEDRLRQSQKMEAIGTLAGGLAHDFNNILYALLGYCQLAMDDAPPDHPVQASLQEIRKAGERASNLVTKMLTLGCRNEGAQVVADLNPLVQEALDLARASLPSTIEFDVQLDNTRNGVKCDPTQIHQVVLNLCTNAGHAMRQKPGRLTVRLAQVALDRKDLARWPKLVPGNYVQLTISDTGCGMDEETLEHIFEPYFTTKDNHEGTGLGLATVQSIILKHAGAIFVESEVSVGTTFTIFFPVTEERRPVAQNAGAPTAAISGSGNVMVIDDEKMIVDVATKSLTKMGFRVLPFTSGEDALEEFYRDPEGVDIVITDQTMPNLTGFELATKLLSIRPDLPIVMTTGYSEQLRDVNLAEAGIALLLPKPLKIAKLAEAVTGLLSQDATKLEV